MKFCKIFITFIFVQMILSAVMYECNASGLTVDPKDAEKLYEQGEYDKALKKYDEVLEEEPENPEFKYNRALALYKKDNMQKAFDSFLSLLGEDNREIKKRTVYNAGDSKFRLGDQEAEGDVSSALEHYKEAADLFKKAMVEDPEDNDAKINYEFTLKKLEELKKLQQQDKQDQQQDQQQDKQDQQQDKQDQQQDKEDQQQDKEDQQQDKQDQQQDKEDQQQEKDNKEQQENEKQQQKQDQDQDRDKNQQEMGKNEDNPAQDLQNSPKPDTIDGQENDGSKNDVDDMTMQQALMLLRGQEEEEARLREAMEERKASGRPKVLRDW